MHKLHELHQSTGNEPVFGWSRDLGTAIDLILQAFDQTLHHEEATSQALLLAEQAASQGQPERTRQIIALLGKSMHRGARYRIKRRRP